MLPLVFLFTALEAVVAVDYTVVDTDTTKFWGNQNELANEPTVGDAFYGQDAQYSGPQPSYVDNGDQTISDETTGLMWMKNALPEKETLADAKTIAETYTLAGFEDWRLPTIKELYSLILFSGIDVAVDETDTSTLTPFISDAFVFNYGDLDSGERLIDAQYASSTEYVWTTMNDNPTMFGVNFADGRIKGYGVSEGGGGKKFYVAYCREGVGYGENSFFDNGDGSVSDFGTGLMWSKVDSGTGMDWETALAWVSQQNAADYLGFSDWRMPDAKELQSIVDYTRSPDTTESAAIDAVFDVTEITNEGGAVDYPYFWSGTTHANSGGGGGGSGVYVAFGRALGFMNEVLLDVHGAGAQRSDPKHGDAGDYPFGRGPQGDVIRIDNFVRLVRTDATTNAPNDATTDAPTAVSTEATNEVTTDAPTDETTDATTNVPTDASTRATTNGPHATTDAPESTQRSSAASRFCLVSFITLLLVALQY